MVAKYASFLTVIFFALVFDDGMEKGKKYPRIETRPANIVQAWSGVMVDNGHNIKTGEPMHNKA